MFVDRGELVLSILQYHDWSETLEQGTEPPTAPGRRSVGCPLLRVCVHLDGLNAEHNFTAGYILYNCVCDEYKFFFTVHFSDESKVHFWVRWETIFWASNSGKAEPWVLKGGEESVMLWGMFSAAVVGSLIQSHSRVNANIYQNLLQPHAVCSLQASPNQPAIFMQDRAPSHCKTDKAVPWS